MQRVVLEQLERRDEFVAGLGVQQISRRHIGQRLRGSHVV